MTRLVRPMAMVSAAAAALLFSAWVARAAFSQARSTGFPLTYVDSKGNIARPTGFREKWTHLGTWFVKDAKGPGYAGLACGRWATASTRSTWRRTWAAILR